VLIQGKKLDGPKEEVLVIPRQEQDIVFKAVAVLDYKEFDQLCPRPTPPEVIKRGGAKMLDPTDRDYQKKVDEWATQRTHWMILQSLSATEGLVWETVELLKPETWKNYEEELRQAGFSEAEGARIVNLVVSANGLDQDKIDEATQRFLAAQEALQDAQASQGTEPKSTPSGEPVKDSA
jgi:hypothetical protein